MADNDSLPELVDQRCTVQWKDTSDGESDGTEELDDRSNNSEISAVELQPISDTQTLDFSEVDKITEVLRRWMPDYILKHIEPHNSKDREPLYSAKLGIEPRIKRCSSSESIVTELSLLSCSSYGKKTRVSETSRRKRRNKRPPTTDNGSTISKWALALQGQKHGAFDKLMRQQSAFQLTPGTSTGITAFDLMEEDEKRQVMKCGRESWIKMNPGLKKSDSSTHINSLTRNKMLVSKRRFSQIHTCSKNGLKEHLKPLVRIANRKNSSDDSNGISVAMLDKQIIRTVTPPYKEKVRMWQVDEKISDVDLNRGMSAKVRERIASTTMALERVSRKSASRPKTTVGCIRTDPNNPQNIRISPELGDVIKQDIQVRMGRPRHHEIRQQDVENLNRGYTLDRSHRNLKVFNWLHSLKEDDFGADDSIDGETDRSLKSMSIIHVHVDAVDEPKLKPINFVRTKTREMTVP